MLRLADQASPSIALGDAPGAKTHVLIDWENVQPSDAELRELVPEATDLWLFHGPNQKNVAAKHASFGERATPIRIARTGKNALDFHLSFYIGYIASRQPEARFVVVSNDKGYEPMLEHAKALGFVASRAGFARKKAARAPAKRTRAPVAKKVAKKSVAPAKSIVKAAKKSSAKAAPAKPATAQKSSATPRRPAAKKAAVAAPVAPAKKTFDQVLAMLQKRPATRLPRKPASLLADIAQMIGTDAEGPEAAAMLERLVSSGRVGVDGQRAMRYALS